MPGKYNKVVCEGSAVSPTRTSPFTSMSAEADGTVDFLKKASIYYKDICPEQSRFLMLRQQRMKGGKEPDGTLCPFCFQWRHAVEQRVRIRPKRRASGRVQKLLRREAARKRLSPEQLKALRRFRNSCSSRMATCHTCNRTSKSRGVSRDTVAALSKAHNTPRNSGKPKTAGRTPHSGGGKVLLKSTEKTPYGTPRSASSESAGTPPSTLGSAKKSAFSRLRKILTLSETPTKEKGGLKAFLSSL
ncbi:UPF0711 protein C18orf21 homolog isoform X2 [Anguilla anguilla]|uniref:UPF0711 protein C18orf21 homolog isoform X2 n=1 Tax=Anguilla anguilla TaxID=7936 RepID=UPI0015ADC6C5|nr:UPF0711 protein C18orf21 homolog isoform X2 [Anguilla anguilla]